MASICAVFVKKLVAGIVARVIRDQAAAVLQRGWLEARSNPCRRLCRMRLTREFGELVNST